MKYLREHRNNSRFSLCLQIFFSDLCWRECRRWGLMWILSETTEYFERLNGKKMELLWGRRKDNRNWSGSSEEIDERKDREGEDAWRRDGEKRRRGLTRFEEEDKMTTWKVFPDTFITKGREGGGSTVGEDYWWNLLYIDLWRRNKILTRPTNIRNRSSPSTSNHLNEYGRLW